MDRSGVYSIQYIQELTKDKLYVKDRNESRIDLDGDLVRGNSQRLQTFFTKGTTCVKCGIQGKFFTKEKVVENDKSWHLELYAIDDNGEEVLMTKDHIIPRSKGGADEVSNYQTMCCRCNRAKANHVTRYDYQRGKMKEDNKNNK